MNNESINKHEAFDDDPEFYFDEHQFSTVVLNSENFAKKNADEIKNLVGLLTSLSREDKDQALLILKRDDGKEMLLSAIADKAFRDNRNILIAACWESGLDFSKYLEVFVVLVLTGNYTECMEAATVIENMEDELPEDIRSIAVQKLNEEIKLQSEKREFYIQVLDFLNDSVK